jgi:hypothetical protein
MSKTDDLIATLQAQVALLQRTLAANGIRAPLPPVEQAEDRADYIAFGSEAHAAFLGLVEVKEGEDTSRYITFTSPGSGRTWRLEDEVTPFMTFPDPAQVAALVLRQKVSELEAGAPKVPDDAPPMWQPADEPAMTPA